MSIDVLDRATRWLKGDMGMSDGEHLVVSLCNEVSHLRASTIRAQVSEFHRAFGQAIGEKPAVPDDDTVELRLRLIAEEFVELLEAAGCNATHVEVAIGRIFDQPVWTNGVDLPEFADALADLAYVIAGANLAFGIDGEAVLAVVHAANMKKLGPDGKPVILPSGKRGKPPGWTPPDIDQELRRQGWAP